MTKRNPGEQAYRKALKAARREARSFATKPKRSTRKAPEYVAATHSGPASLSLPRHRH